MTETCPICGGHTGTREDSDVECVAVWFELGAV